jgi:thioredoxin reductase
LDTLVIEREAFGGQAGTSSMIRNYLGFSRGISGKELSIQAYQQALSFGARFFFVHEAKSLRTEDSLNVVELQDGIDIRSRCVVLSMGVTYRRLGIPSLEELNGLGVFYGAARSEAKACKEGSLPAGWSLERPPMMLETSIPGVFAAGDVRYQSIKRVASAVGEGSIVITQIHQYLTSLIEG